MKKMEVLKKYVSRFSFLVLTRPIWATSKVNWAITAPLHSETRHLWSILPTLYFCLAQLHLLFAFWVKSGIHFRQQSSIHLLQILKLPMVLLNWTWTYTQYNKRQQLLFSQIYILTILTNFTKLCLYTILTPS